jgi:hypothetical protein
LTLGNDWPGEGDLRAVRWIAMRHGADHIRATAGPLSTFDHHRVSQYAHAATILLHAAAHIDSAEAASVPFPETAGKVQQAVGVVMERATVGAVTALRSLRAWAYHSQRRTDEVVAEVRAGQLPGNATTPR